jgi:hypothetical protein
MQSTAKLTDEDKRLYEVVRYRFDNKLISVNGCIRMLRSIVSDREYFEKVGRDEFLRSLKLE